MQSNLIHLSHDKNKGVRWNALKALSSTSFQIPYKEQAWTDLIKLIQDVDRKKQLDSVESSESISSQDSEKWRLWKGLHKLTWNNNSELRRSTIDVIISGFPQIPDTEKQKAWEDLIRLAHDTDKNVRICSAHSLESAFPYVPDKEKAWEDLQMLAQDKESYLRRGAAYALGSAIPYVSNKEQVWSDLHQLSQDEFSDVRRGAAYALGSAFSYIPDKEKAWADMILLTQDEFSEVRAYANHSLGRASIFKATEATESKENFKKELEKAIEFFEKASSEATYSNPANFCLPFYRSFYAITFKKDESEDEIQQYLAEAKSAVEGSVSKEKLLEAVENLANALNEAQKAQEIDFDVMKSDLNSYRRYCERASDLLVTTEEKAPSATKALPKNKLANFIM